jgi:ribosomal-protein-alanine N-acetyltransferase
MRLETKRLVLRDWEKGDVEDLVEGLSNLSVSKWLAFVPHPYTERDARIWIGSCMIGAKPRTNRRSFEFAIELKSEGKVIGGVQP